MFKRFQPPKAPAPFPPVEEDIRCPQCGFNHVGWAFEPGYAKLCVKCGKPLEASQEGECSEEQNEERAGFFGRVFNGMFGKRSGREAEEEIGKDPETGPPGAEAEPEAPVEPHDFLASIEAGAQPRGERETAGEGQGEREEDVGLAEPYVEPPAPEAAHVGACKREGRLLAEQGRHEEAIAMLEKVVAFEPNDIETWGVLGRIHYRGTKNLPQSIECSRKALEIDEDLVEVKGNLCLALLFDGQFDLAKKGFLELIRSVRNSRGYDEESQESCKALLQDCLGELYVAKKEASGELLGRIKDIIELLEIEKIYFH
jgi:tetratricopeptide (TPR) repeat protein